KGENGCAGNRRPRRPQQVRDRNDRSGNRRRRHVLAQEVERQRRRVTEDGFLRPALSALVPYEPGKPVEEVQRELGLHRVVKLALVEHRHNVDALRAGVTPRTKLVYICDPNNPTGTMNTRAELDAYFDRVPDHVLTVVDQAYFEYIDDADYPDAVDEYFKGG